MASPSRSRWRMPPEAAPPPVPAPPPLPRPDRPGPRQVPHPPGGPEGNPESETDGLAWQDQLAAAWEYVYRQSPPWLVSFVFHVILLTILGLIVISGPSREIYVLTLGETLEQGEQLDDEALQEETPPLDVETPEIALDPVPVDNPLAAMPELDLAAEGLVRAQSIDAATLGSALAGRAEGAKAALLAKYGGNRTTEAAVILALEWLARQQRSNGSWALNGPYSD
ncbi:MAG TPA: hypothetical protein ENJ62_05685, partial [Bryobacterales bacterium]|nr:hypothetical protein [Bryobacterales bacterium]